MLQKTTLYYFSPTGGTKKVGQLFCENLAEQVQYVDLGKKGAVLEQTDSEIIVAAAPVFAGRIPELVTEKLKTLDGKNKRAVTIAVYGNRAFDDALLELNHVMKGQGFTILASGAVNAQHSMVPEVGANRPDEEDIKDIQKYAQITLEKLGQTDIEEPVVPGNCPYRDGMTVAATPITLSGCVGCGKCGKICPTEAITVHETTVETKPDKCMLCMACVAACPEKVRVLPEQMQDNMNQKLGPLAAVRRENEWY